MSIILKDTSGVTLGIIGRILNDVIAGVLAYTLTFIGCDLIYNDFNLQQSIKSSYWFFLGPFLWRWGTAIPFILEILKNFVEGKWNSIKGKLIDWAEGIIPGLMLPVVPYVGDLIDSAGPSMIENYKYIEENKSFYY